MKSLTCILLSVLMTPLLTTPLCAQDSEIKIHALQPLEFLKLSLSDQEQTWLRHKQSLVVGVVERDSPPYHEINERQELEGISADYLAALQRELATPIRVQTYPSAEDAYRALFLGQIDMVDNTTQDEANHYQMALSPLYAVTELALFTESGDLNDYSSNLDLTTTRIAATRGMALELYQRTGGQGPITLYESSLAAMASVLDGESDAYLGDTLSTRYLSSQLFSSQLVVNISRLRPEIRVGFAVAQGNAPLRGLLDRALGSLTHCQIASALALWGGDQTCGPSSFRTNLNAAERDWLDNTPPVRVVISEDLAPYAFFNPRGRFNGIASSLLEIIRRKSGLRFEILRVPSVHDADTWLHDGRADLSVLTHIGPHQRALAFTRAFVTTPYVIVRRKDAALLMLNSYTSGKVATANGYLQRDLLSRTYPNLQIEETRTIAEAFNRVRTGRVDYALAPANLARYYLSYKYENDLKINGIISGQEAQIAFAAPETKALLISVLDKALAQIGPQEKLQLIDRWRANSATDDKYWEGTTSFIWKTLATLCVMLLLAAWGIISQRRRIIRKHSDLQQRQLLLDQLRAAKESAEKASRSKSVFLATMSHEIRTPLNAIIGMLELVLTRRKNIALNNQSVHIAYESAQDLLALIGDILDISRIESGNLTLRPEIANLKELIETVAKVFQGLARQKDLCIQVELDALASEQVWIDGLKFKQILSNLMSNAIKFTERGGIRIRCLIEDSDERSLALRVSVIDTGPGIAPSQLEKVFTPFFEIDSAINNPNTGSGLGLSISHSLSTLMDGSLIVQSELGVGTTITFSARFERVSKEPGELLEQPQQSRSSTLDQALTVLIVEDHLPSQYLLDQQLHYLGHDVLIASNGLEGLAMWQEHDIDIIITDCNMPEMSGHDMTQAIRRMEGQLGVRPCIIVGLTAGALREEQERCLASGMNSALAKPVNLAGLNRVIPMFNRAPEAEEVPMPGGDGHIRNAMAKHVISSNVQELQALSLAMAENNRPALGAIAHKLKSTAYLLDMQALLELCESLEALLASNAQQQQVNHAVTRLEQALQALNQSLQSP
ncbi:ATP-binding protein [Pseudomonas protegens]|uniref:ATP-binding protein n=1 Tax=Pseudomonas protegens TaxID=380021 RepID=UPI00223A9417|nr:transporter substrate-binding domain-containing protein [Pseudomonas protegens]